MESQTHSHQQTSLSVSHLTKGNWIVITFFVVFMVSLFLDWTGPFFITKGFAYVFYTGISGTSGFPNFSLATPIAAVICVLLCFCFLRREPKRNRNVSIAQIVLAILGVIPFALLPLELKTWSPPGTFEVGGWLALLAMIGMLIGAIVTKVNTSVDKKEATMI